jgi:hypothetical protein
MAEKRGRKSAYDTKIKPRLLEIAGWCRDGHTDKNICVALRITEKTFCKYKLLKSELLQATLINKEIADLTMENSLYKRGNGFQYEETTQELRENEEGDKVLTITKVIEKMVVPDTTAASLWLRNRRPDKWRDKQQVDNTVKMEITDDRTPTEVMLARKIPIPMISTPDITDMPSTAPTETPEAPLQIQAPTQAPGQDIEIARLKAQLASQGKLIEELQKKDEIKFMSTDDPENINSPFGKK